MCTGGAGVALQLAEAHVPFLSGKKGQYIVQGYGKSHTSVPQCLPTLEC